MKKEVIIAIVVSVIVILILAIGAFAMFDFDSLFESKNKENLSSIKEQAKEMEERLKEENEKTNKLLSSIEEGENKSEETSNRKNPVATIEVENFGTMKVKLYPDQAPNTVKNFIKLANRGFYNNLTYHRVIKDFMIQGGDPKGDGTGGATLKDLKDGGEDKEYCIEGEFSANSYKNNNIEFKRGVIAMARADYTSYGFAKEGYNSASSQFFIMHADYDALNKFYAPFGEVVEGIEVVDKIADVQIDPSGQGDRPVNPPVIKSITVDTYGVDYGEPETLEPFDIQQ